MQRFYCRPVCKVKLVAFVSVLAIPFLIYMLTPFKDEGDDYTDFDFHLPQGAPWDRDVNGVPQESALYALSRKDVSRIYHNYIMKKQYECGYVVRAGNSGDGGWNICMDQKYAPSTPCLVYSFGINYDFSFDDAMADTYGCVVHAYDPSMKDADDHLRGQRIHFHKIGLSNDNTMNEIGWKMNTFSTILKDNNHTDAIIDILKFDIEKSEMTALPEMLKSGALKNVKQVLFEMHVKMNTQSEASRDDYIYVLSLLLDLYKEGFRIFDSHQNMNAGYHSVYGVYRTGCHEIYMIRKLTNDLRA